MNYTPTDILNDIFENHLDADFLFSLANHVNNYSIGEIVDRTFEQENETFYLVSKSYGIHAAIEDDDIITALMNGLYVSAFISRKESAYQVHFLVHRYPLTMKEQFEEEITNEVIRYIMLRTIIALRLDHPDKVRAYIGGFK